MTLLRSHFALLGALVLAFCAAGARAQDPDQIGVIEIDGPAAYINGRRRSRTRPFICMTKSAPAARPACASG